MNQFKPTYSRLRSVLVSSVALVGLASAAQAQVAELKGLMDNKDFGGSASFYLPLGNVNTGMPFLSIGAGLLGGSKSGEALVGYGQSLGDNVGIRGYAGVGLKDSHHNLFTTARAGVEVSVGGFGLNVSGSVPFGKTRQVAKNGHTDVVLVDPTGQQCDATTGQCVPVPPSCSNPLPGQVRHCEIGIGITEPSYEKALKGFEVGVDYQLQVGGVWLRPSLEYYRYGNGLVSGAKAGLEVSVPLTSQLSLNIGAGGRKELRGDNKGLSGFGSLGISYHFGTTLVSQLSSLEHRFAQAPNLNQRSVTTQTEKGTTTVYRSGTKPNDQGLLPVPPIFTATWDQTGKAISEVWFFDHNTENNIPIGTFLAKEGALLVFDGSNGNINVKEAIEFSRNYQGMVGGGSTLTMHATIFGAPTTITALIPGTRATVVQSDNTKNVFQATNIENPVLYGLDIKGGKDGAAFLESAHARVVQVNGSEAAGNGFSFDKSKQVFLSDVSSSAAGRNGFYFVHSDQAVLINAKSILNKDEGFKFYLSADAILYNIFASGKNTAYTGLAFYESTNARLQKIEVTGGGDGVILAQSDHAFISDLYVHSLSLGYGVLIDASHDVTIIDARIVDFDNVGLQIQRTSDNVLLENVSLEGNGTVTSAGVVLVGGGKVGKEVSFHNVSVHDTKEGYVFSKNPFDLSPSVVKDLGGNTAVSVTDICDGVVDTTGSVLVNGKEKCQ